jgi:large conductance mechanosensitive channel
MVRRRNAIGGFLQDFRDFALKGNVIDLAVAVIIGGAFGKIISSFVEDLVMPGLINPILVKTGSDWREAVIGPGIKIGSFMGAIVDFLIIAFILFLVIRAIEKAKRRKELEEAESPSTPDPLLQSQAELKQAIEQLTQTIQSRNL